MCDDQHTPVSMIAGQEMGELGEWMELGECEEEQVEQERMQTWRGIWDRQAGQERRAGQDGQAGAEGRG
jgi:hypothetical protein